MNEIVTCEIIQLSFVSAKIILGFRYVDRIWMLGMHLWNRVQILQSQSLMMLDSHCRPNLKAIELSRSPRKRQWKPLDKLWRPRCDRSSPKLQKYNISDYIKIYIWVTHKACSEDDPSGFDCDETGTEKAKIPNDKSSRGDQENQPDGSHIRKDLVFIGVVPK